MPVLQFALCCTRPLVDGRTNQLSVIDVIETITLPREQTGFFALAVVCLWLKTIPVDIVETFSQRITFKDPAGNVVSTIVNEDMEIPQLRLRAMSFFQGLPLPDDGMYHFSVEVQADDDWREISRIPIFVQHVDAQPQPPAN